MPQSPSIPKKAEKLPWRALDGHSVIINSSRGEVHELDSVGSAIWILADGSRSVEQIAQSLSESYDIDESVALQDSQEFLSALHESGLIEWT